MATTATSSAADAGGQESVYNKVGLSFHPANGSLFLDHASFALEFQDSKANRTRLCHPYSPAPALVRTTWSELGKEASLQLYFEGHEAEDKDSDDDDDDNDDDEAAAPPSSSSRNNNKKTKPQPKFLRVHGLPGQDRARFETFFRQGYSRLADSAGNDGSAVLEDEPWDVKGGNFGELTLSKLKRCIVIKDFDTETMPSIEIPLSNVSQIAAPGKNEVEIQYTPSTSLGNKSFELSVIRFHIPGEDNGPSIPGDDGQNKNEEAEDWRARFKTVSDLYDEQDEDALGLVCHIGEEICEFVSPKGRYDLDLYRDFFRMRGKTYDFKIPYSHLVHIYLLDHPEQDAKFLMMTLNQHIRHGHQNVSQLVMVVQDEDTELELAQTQEQLRERYGESGGLQPIMKGLMPESVAKLLKGVSSKKVLIMPLTGFHAEGGGAGGGRRERCVKCNVRTTAGYLYPMKTALVFLHKPVLSIKYEKMDSIEFKRNLSTLSNDSFDLEVVYQEDGDRAKKIVEFALIPRKQFDTLRKFFVELNTVKIKRKDELGSFFSAANKLSAAVASSAGATANKLKAAAAGDKKKESTTINDLGSDDDSDEAEDSDFDEGGSGGSGGSDDGSSSSGSDSDDSSLEDEVPMGTLAEELGDDAGGDMEEDAAATVVTGKRVRKPSGLDPLPAKTKKKAKLDESASAKKPAAAPAKKKDKNAPKAARNAYYYFQEAKKDELASLTFAERSQKASEMWKQVTDRAEYEALAAKDKERHRLEMLTYVPPPSAAADSGDEEDGKPAASAATTKAPKDKNAPKAARTAYTYFGDELRPTFKDENLSFGDMNKKLAQLWKDQQDKSKWEALAAQDKLRREEELKTYVPPTPAAAAMTTKKTSATKKASSAESTKKPATVAAAAGASKKKKPAELTSMLPSGSSSSDDDEEEEEAAGDKE